MLFCVGSGPQLAGVIRRLRIDDHEGNRNKFELPRQRFDRDLGNARFRFTPPAGARRARDWELKSRSRGGEGRVHALMTRDQDLPAAASHGLLERPWLRFPLALAAAECGARAFLSLTATWMGVLLGETAPERAQLGLGVVMLLAGVTEGAMIGFAQAWALRRAFRLSSTRRLVLASALSFGLVWLLGTLLSGAEPRAPSAAMILAVAAAAGALLGGVLGVGQSLAFGRLDGGWVVANVLAWAAGMLAGALVTQLVPDGPFTVGVLGIEMLSGAVTGAVVGSSLFSASGSVDSALSLPDPRVEDPTSG